MTPLIAVIVRVPPVLRTLTGGRPKLELSLPEGATVADALDQVERDHPALVRRVRDEQGVLRQHVNVFVGEESVRVLGGLETILRADSEITILAAISGG